MLTSVLGLPPLLLLHTQRAQTSVLALQELKCLIRESNGAIGGLLSTAEIPRKNFTLRLHEAARKSLGKFSHP